MPDTLQVALVRNMSPGPTVLSLPGPPRVEIEWAGRGDPSGGDLQEVPESVLSDVNFRRVANRGILSVEAASDEAMAAIAAQGQRWASAQQASDKAALAAMDQTKANDIISVPCMGPNSRGTGDCGDAVPVREKELAARPPLCQQHSHLAHQFVYAETGEVKDGKPVGRWSRGTMGAPLPSMAENVQY